MSKPRTIHYVGIVKTELVINSPNDTDKSHIRKLVHASTNNVYAPINSDKKVDYEEAIISPIKSNFFWRW